MVYIYIYLSTSQTDKKRVNFPLPDWHLSGWRVRYVPHLGLEEPVIILSFPLCIPMCPFVSCMFYNGCTFSAPCFVLMCFFKVFVLLHLYLHCLHCRSFSLVSFTFSFTCWITSLISNSSCEKSNVLSVSLSDISWSSSSSSELLNVNYVNYFFLFFNFILIPN